MRLGVCIGIKEISLLEQAGYDYAELKAIEVLAPDTVDEKKFNNYLKTIERSKVKAEIFSKFLPKSIRVVGPNVSFKKFKDYVDIVVPRARKLGGEIIVWGSGDSRNIPEDFSIRKAQEQFKRCLEYTVGICAKNKMRIAIEPLSHPWSNWLNTVDECLNLIEKVDSKEVGITADVDHMVKESEDIEKSLYKAEKRIFHVHLRDNNGKAPGKGFLDFKKVAKALIGINYRERGSIEAEMELEKELKLVKDFLDGIFGDVG